MSKVWTVEAIHGTTGDCDPEQIYGQMDPPVFATQHEAQQWIDDNADSAREAAPGVTFIIWTFPDLPGGR